MSYHAVMRVRDEQPDLVPLIRACFDYGTETFKKKWVAPRSHLTLEPLVNYGVLEKVHEAGADGNADYRFVDRDGAGHALSEIR
jgi:hypothetical protein